MVYPFYLDAKGPIKYVNAILNKNQKYYNPYDLIVIESWQTQNMSDYFMISPQGIAIFHNRKVFTINQFN